MPTSPFKWQSQQQATPIYNTFGNKRKLDCEMELDSEDVIAEKRPCLRAYAGVLGDALQQQVPVYKREECQHDEATTDRNIAGSDSLDDCEMDVDGGVGFVPSGPGIGSGAAVQAPQIQTTNVEAAKQFCESYCGAAVESSNSGDLRCYCRPSWEEMMNTQHYISDSY